MLAWLCYWTLLTVVSCDLGENEALNTEINSHNFLPEWFLALVQNLFTYSLVIVPGALAIRWIKQTNYIEKISKLCLQPKM